MEAGEEFYQDGRFFKLVEFACPTSQRIVVSTDLLYKLDALRARMKRPITVLSGYRSPQHNAKVGGSPTSQHLSGRAVDIQIIDRDDGLSMLEHADMLGFRGIGLYPDRLFVHLDVRPKVFARWGEVGGKITTYNQAIDHLIGMEKKETK